MGEAKRKRALQLATQEIKLRFQVGYLLVVEWLGDERKTGRELAQAVEKYDQARVVFVECKCASDVLDALSAAAHRYRKERLHPILHIEAHGVEPDEGKPSIGIAGPDGNGQIAVITWREIAGSMRTMNLLTGFNLVVVGASCYGISQIDTFNVDDAAPFSVAVGFARRVSSRTLYDAMRAFYRAIFLNNGTSIAHAVETANSELLATDGEMLVHTNCLKFGTHLLRAFAEHDADPAHRGNAMARRQSYFIERGQFFSIDQLEQIWSTQIVASCEKSVAKWFAYESIPENKTRFRIDVRSIFTTARSRRAF